MATDKNQLLKAIQSETKALIESSTSKVETDFILKNWQVFAENKSQIYGCLKHQKNLTGQGLLDLLGLNNCYIERVSKQQLLAACYSFKDSDLYKTYMKYIQRSKSGTAFFIVYTSGIVVTNQFSLEKENMITHILKGNDKVNDLYWAPVKDVSDILRVY